MGGIYVAAYVNFSALNINTISNASGVFTGENVQQGWGSHSKNNQCLGDLNGNANLIANPLNCIFDPDLMDSPINDQDIQGSAGPGITKLT